MTKEEKRYKILKKKKYEEQISKEEKNAVYRALIMALNVTGAVVVFSYFTPDAEMIEKISTIGLGLMNTGFAADSLKSVIEAITRKTALECKVEEIINELKLDENKESRGMSK